MLVLFVAPAWYQQDGVNQRYYGVNQRYNGANQRYKGVNRRSNGVNPGLASDAHDGIACNKAVL